jgi:hypothetical protein
MRIRDKIERSFFDEEGNQKKWFVVLGVLLPIILTVVFSVWGIRISIESENNREQIDTLSNLARKSQQQIDFLQKIYIVSDSTNKSTARLKELPDKISILNSTLDSLNVLLAKETKRLGRSYSELNSNYDILIRQQKDYLDKISRVVDLTNQQIIELQKNNAMINQEFSRRSVVAVMGKINDEDHKRYIVEFVVYNLGQIEFDIETLDFKITNLDFNCVGNPHPNVDHDLIYMKDSNLFRLTNNGLAKTKVNVGRGVSVRFQGGCYIPSGEYSVEFSITYSNKYESKTIQGYVQFQ